MVNPRKNFYANELDIDRMNEVLEYVIENLTLKEILKMIREISYDMVCYYDKTNCGIIYKDKSYDKEHQWQSCMLQRLLRDACDLFGQSIINKNKFNEDYLNKWLNGGSMELQITQLKEKINELEEELKERNAELY